MLTFKVQVTEFCSVQFKDYEDNIFYFKLFALEIK